MAKGIALSTIHHGAGKDKDGNHVVQVFNPGDEMDLPNDVMKALCAANAAEMHPGAAKKAV
jgi:hypothetical protein